MDGERTCDFTPFSAVFQTYQDDERMVMKNSAQFKRRLGSSNSNE